MRSIALVVLACVLVACGSGGGPPPANSPPASETADAMSGPTPIPATWVDGLLRSRGGQAITVSCLDANGDGVLDARDGAELAGLSIPLARDKACAGGEGHREYYAGPPAGGAPACDGGGPAPLVIVAVGGGGTELMAPQLGESLGLLDITNAVQARAAERGIVSAPILSTGAIDAADLPQTRMGEFLAAELRRRLEELPCLRAVLLGHSHGGVTVTSIAAALDSAYGGRIYAVVLDRSNALYDRPSDTWPLRAPVLNVFQTNEGWHGEPVDLPNVTNLDGSAAVGPRDPSEGDFSPATVSHLTLDDAPEVQRRIADAVFDWLAVQAR
jgi:pimeloyl-ACP methyl ester carboxylesterase